MSQRKMSVYTHPASTDEIKFPTISAAWAIHGMRPYVQDDLPRIWDGAFQSRRAALYMGVRIHDYIWAPGSQEACFEGWP
jgi:hypothetical protein